MDGDLGGSQPADAMNTWIPSSERASVLVRNAKLGVSIQSDQSKEGRAFGPALEPCLDVLIGRGLTSSNASLGQLQCISIPWWTPWFS